jgi:hypothetical protein
MLWISLFIGVVLLLGPRRVISACQEESQEHQGKSLAAA